MDFKLIDSELLEEIMGKDETLKEHEKKLKLDIKPLMVIKYKLKRLEAIKVFFEALIMLFAWCLVIYSQDFFSSLIFCALTYYSIKLTRGALTFVWALCLIVFVSVYFFTLMNMSSYNCA